jgi:hypothetical protein
MVEALMIGWTDFCTCRRPRRYVAARRGIARVTRICGLSSLTRARYGAAPRREPASGSSRKGLFPHLYGPLPVGCITRAVRLPLAANGKHIFPAGIPPETET